MSSPLFTCAPCAPGSPFPLFMPRPLPGALPDPFARLRTAWRRLLRCLYRSWAAITCEIPLGDA